MNKLSIYNTLIWLLKDKLIDIDKFNEIYLYYNLNDRN